MCVLIYILGFNIQNKKSKKHQLDSDYKKIVYMIFFVNKLSENKL